MATQTKKNNKKGKSKAKIILFAIELIIILAMVAVLWWVMSRDEEERPKVTVLDASSLAIPSQVLEEKEEGGTMHGYLNIALFGVDALNDAQLFKDSRSDSTMIASINLDTGDIKLVSIYRDSYLNIGKAGELFSESELEKRRLTADADYYTKCNAAYAYGGAAQAVKMLNMNLDMDITAFITVGYKGLSKVIDGLGGVYVEIDSEELKHINNYQQAVAEVLQCEYTKVTETGYQRLDGVQAAAYCRIRQTAGSDFQRTARQREVLKSIEAQAKKADLATLWKVFDNAIGDIYYSWDEEKNGNIRDLLANIANYSIVDEAGFPNETMRSNANIDAHGACIIPDNLVENVEWLHHFFFEDEEYTVSESVEAYSEKILSNVAKYSE